MENSGSLIILIILGGVIFLFFVMRSIMTWYWKIDEIITNQSHQSKLIYEQNQLLRQSLGIRPAGNDSMPKEEIEKKAKLFDQTQSEGKPVQ